MNKEPKIEDYKNVKDWGKAWVYFHFPEIKKRREQEGDQPEVMENALEEFSKNFNGVNIAFHSLNSVLSNFIDEVIKAYRKQETEIMLQKRKN